MWAAHLFERPESGERAVLVHLKFNGERSEPRSSEFKELVASAGAWAVSSLTANAKTPDARYLIGTGKLEEIRASVHERGAEVVIIDHELSPAQERNIEQALKVRVLDRVGLILDIFAQRASSFEGKLQVELAQLKHLSTRLVRGWTHLERQKGGIGLRGPGEKQLETDRRLLSERIKHINQRLVRVQKRRALGRRSRHKAEVPLVALVGYTNAGKSTLFNALTGANVGAANRLFQTLDPTLRRLDLGVNCEAVVADTVGFVRDLPHDLVAAFRATLEETLSASLLLHVVDTSDPERRVKMEQVDEVLEAIGAKDIPQLIIYNKIDCLDKAGNGAQTVRVEPKIDRDQTGKPYRVWLSARECDGVDMMHEALIERIRPSVVRHRVRLPMSAGRLRARLFELGNVLQESAAEDGNWLMEVEIPEASFEQLRRTEGLESRYIAA